MRTIEAANVTRWFGKILTSRRRQNSGAVSSGRATQVSTNPLRMKKNDTPTTPDA
jgi:hypothetical protein